MRPAFIDEFEPCGDGAQVTPDVMLKRVA